MRTGKKKTSFKAVMTRLNATIAGEPRQVEVSVESSGRFNADSLKDAFMSGKCVRVTIECE